MEHLLLHNLHEVAHAQFSEVTGHERVLSYGDTLAEHAALSNQVGLVDLSFRSRLCLTGEDRVRFAHGQVTNDVQALQEGEGCYAALVTAKGKMVTDLNIYRLHDELLLDFEPGLSAAVQARLEKYIVAEDVQVIDVAPHYGLLSVQGPQAEAVLRAVQPALNLPAKGMSFVALSTPGAGDMYVVNHARLGSSGFDLFVANSALAEFAAGLIRAVTARQGRLCGWEAWEMARIEASVPCFGIDMDESTLPPEAGLEARAISYKKGCYIGQEVINRIRTYGQVAKSLRGLRLADALGVLPVKGDKLYHEGKEVGFITSATASPRFKANLALGYVRREANLPGTEMRLQTNSGNSAARLIPLPFGENFA